MEEFDNRAVAKKYAEYITGESLRKYVAQKVRLYVGNNITVFDGAAGSGQLEQFVNPKHLYAFDIQDKACEALKRNYANSSVKCCSFFEFPEIKELCDCVIMNPPFSIKLKDLSTKEQENITNLYPWKKSGVVDDIFIIHSLKYTKRFAFYICFPGIAYRKTEQPFRDILKNTVQELNLIENAFTDTSIPVLFLIIDKEKKDANVKKEIYNCKTSTVEYEQTSLSSEDMWSQPHKEIQKEEIDIVALEKELEAIHAKNQKLSSEIDNLVEELQLGRW